MSVHVPSATTDHTEGWSLPSGFGAPPQPKQGLVFSFLYRQWSFGKITKYEDYKLDQWTNSRESFLIFSGILYGEPRSQQSLHPFSLKIFKSVSSEGFLRILRALFQWKLGALSKLPFLTQYPKLPSLTLINLENILSEQLISQYISLQAVWTTAKAAITQVYSYLSININLIAVFNK